MIANENQDKPLGWNVESVATAADRYAVGMVKVQETGGAVL